MDDEFKLCWKNFQDNIASGFQSFYDRRDLVDVTLACDGKLLQAHKIVLAICSPYFQEIFITNPCKHPIIILKDVSYTIMCELLEFMYQGVVNVKHTELQAFMKIGQLLQIKGLATNSSTTAACNDKINSNHHYSTSADNESSATARNCTPEPSTTSPLNDGDNNTECTKEIDKKPAVQTNSNSNTPKRNQSPVPSPASPSLNITNVNVKSNDSQPYHIGGGSASGSVSSHKRHLGDLNTDSLSIYSRNKMRRSFAPTDHSSENNDGASDMGSGNGNMDHINAEDFFLPHMSMVEPRYELPNMKRDERSDHHSHPNGPSSAAAAAAAASLRNSFNPSAFGLDYTFYKNGGPSSTSSGGGPEYPNELNTSGDFGKGFANHMDIPPNCPNVVMLSSTSLLHGNCVFNRNNTVATQQGMKTYWLCKSYRISMCRARCITHQGKIISATGMHNHSPHMRGNNAGGVGNTAANSSDVIMGPNSNSGNHNPSNCPPPPLTQGNAGNVGLRFSQNISSAGGNIFQPNFHATHHGHPMSPMTPPSMQHSHPISADPATSMNSTTSHHFTSSMSNLIQHQGSHQQQLLPPTTVSNVPHHHHHPSIQTIMHGSAINTSQQSHNAGGYNTGNASSSMDHNRISNQPSESYDTNNKTDAAITVQNAAALSPSDIVGDGRCSEKGETHNLNNSLVEEHQSSSSHLQHQSVQVIDSITISPGHNFKMEPL